MNHLDALELRLSQERERLARAKTDSERAARKVWIAQIEKEITGEKQFLNDGDISLDDLRDELAR